MNCLPLMVLMLLAAGAPETIAAPAAQAKLSVAASLPSSGGQRGVKQAGAPETIAAPAAPAGAAWLAARGRTPVLTSLRAGAHPLAARVMGNEGGKQASAPDTGVPPAKLTHEDLYFQQTELARNFLAALADGDIDELLELGADPFSFDGREVAGRKLLRRAWQRLARRKSALLRRLPEARVETMLFADAIERFGPPPAKFRKLGLRRCHFAAVRLTGHRGFLLIMKKDARGRWRVVAVAE